MGNLVRFKGFKAKTQKDSKEKTNKTAVSFAEFLSLNDPLPLPLLLAFLSSAFKKPSQSRVF